MSQDAEDTTPRAMEDVWLDSGMKIPVGRWASDPCHRCGRQPTKDEIVKLDWIAHTVLCATCDKDDQRRLAQALADASKRGGPPRPVGGTMLDKPEYKLDKPEYKKVGKLLIDIGDGEQNIGTTATDVYLCPRCSALVALPELHVCIDCDSYFIAAAEDITPHEDPVVQAVAEKLADFLYCLEWDMPGFDHAYVRELAEVTTEVVRRVTAERDMAELEWWRQSFACRFGPNNLPHVGDALLGYRFHLFYDHPEDGLIRWKARGPRHRT